MQILIAAGARTCTRQHLKKDHRACRFRWLPFDIRVEQGSGIQELDMARQHKLPEKWRPLMGCALLGLGLHILFGNLDRTAAQLSHSLGASGGQALGALPSLVLATSQAVKAYALDHRGFWLALLRLLVSFWPLLLVVVGTILLRDAVTEKVKALPPPAKYFGNKDSECRFRCPSFDA
jgi:hypothetical protein